MKRAPPTTQTMQLQQTALQPALAACPSPEPQEAAIELNVSTPAIAAARLALHQPRPDSMIIGLPTHLRVAVTVDSLLPVSPAYSSNDKLCLKRRFDALLCQPPTRQTGKQLDP